MKKILIQFIFFILPICGFTQFDYLSPIPNSQYHSKFAEICIRPGYPVSTNDLALFKQAQIIGSISGNISFSVVLVEQRKTLILRPEQSFAPTEKVHVFFPKEIKKNDLAPLDNFSYSFTISANIKYPEVKTEEEILSNFIFRSPDTIPDNFPTVEIETWGTPASGRYFLTPVFGPYNLMILNQDGSPLHYSTTSTISRTNNLDKIDDQTLVVNDLLNFAYVSLDTTYSPIRAYTCQNGYSLDFHDFHINPDNENALLMSYDKQIVDMSMIISGGNPNAFVTGTVIQEIDENDNVVFQWRSWDHFNILDGISEGNNPIDFTTGSFNYTHSNSLEYDEDGHIIISHRHMNEVTKIDRNSGNTIWRLGGKNNQFTFVNDSLMGINQQHDARRLDNGNLSIFDNGMLHNPPVTRIVEYELDETNLTANLIWSYANENNQVTGVTGNAQRLPNGNTLINWGRRENNGTNFQDLMLEVDPLGNKIMEMRFTDSISVGYSYRGYKYEWLPNVNTNTNNISSNNIIVNSYPNPASDQIRFYPKEMLPNYSLQIFDSAGKMVYFKPEINEWSPSTPIELTIKSWDNGHYFYQFSNKKNVISGQFIIQH